MQNNLVTTTLEHSAFVTLTSAEERTKRLNEKLKRELGIVYDYLYEPDVIELMLNSDGMLWVERLGQAMQCIGHMSFNQAESLMSTVASSFKTVLTSDNPILECELPIKGARFEALIPPIVSHPVFTIRLKASKIFTLNDYVNNGGMTAKQATFLSEAIKNRKNILVVGGTSSGKTTLTNAIIAKMVELTPDHRLVIVEDTAELQCTANNAVILRATDSVDMLRLLKVTMRLRPDRILVGEVRGPEALALLKAWNTGHPGGVATVHANNAAAGLIRIEQLIAEATQSDMKALISEAINIIIFIAKTPEGRRVEQILSVMGYEGSQYIFAKEEN